MRIFLLSYNVFCVDDYMTLIIGAFDSKEKINQIIMDFDNNYLFDSEDAIIDGYDLKNNVLIENVYVIYFKPKKETITKIIAVTDSEEEAIKRLSYLQKDKSLQLIEVEFFIGVYNVNIPFWSEGYRLSKIN